MGGPRCPGLASVTPINDLHGTEGPALAKGERLMRCKVGSIHRLLDLYGWAQLGHAAVTVSTPTSGGGPRGCIGRGLGGNLGGYGAFGTGWTCTGWTHHQHPESCTGGTGGLGAFWVWGRVEGVC